MAEPKDREGDMTNVEQLPVKRELAAGAPLRAIIPTTMEDAYRIAVAVVKAKMAPRDMDTPEKCLIAIMQGLEVGLTPMQSIQRIAIIGNRPSIWGDAAIGLVRASGLCEYIREWIDGEGNTRVARCEAKRRGEAEAIKGSFSVQDAIVAKLWNKDGTWQTHPKRMLQMRARGFVLRDGFADVLGGMYLREELEGEVEIKDVTPKPPNDRPRTVEDMMQAFIDENQKQPEPKTAAEGGMRYAPELSAENLKAVQTTLADIDTADELITYAASMQNIIERMTPDDQSKAEKSLKARAKRVLEDDQPRPSFFAEVHEDGEA